MEHLSAILPIKTKPDHFMIKLDLKDSYNVFFSDSSATVESQKSPDLFGKTKLIEVTSFRLSLLV
jgi:hypothetical protein